MQPRILNAPQVASFNVFFKIQLFQKCFCFVWFCFLKFHSLTQDLILIIQVCKRKKKKVIKNHRIVDQASHAIQKTQNSIYVSTEILQIFSSFNNRNTGHPTVNKLSNIYTLQYQALIIIQNRCQTVNTMQTSVTSHQKHMCS